MGFYQMISEIEVFKRKKKQLKKKKIGLKLMVLVQKLVQMHKKLKEEKMFIKLIFKKDKLENSKMNNPLVKKDNRIQVQQEIIQSTKLTKDQIKFYMKNLGINSMKSVNNLILYPKIKTSVIYHI